MSEATKSVLGEVAFERGRQEGLKAAGKFLWSCADSIALRAKVAAAITDAEKLAVLAEEFGEVSAEVVEAIIHRDRELPELAAQDRRKMRSELIQVAAVCVAWVEALNEEGVKSL